MTYKTVGFTGTQRGMTAEQRKRVKWLLLNLGVTELHHGDCIGADAEAHEVAAACGASIVIHPPADAKNRAFCDGSLTRILPAKDYIKRNRDIVFIAEALIAAPKDFKQPKSLRGQGTWSTIVRARLMRKPTFIVLPDGRFTEEYP